MEFVEDGVDETEALVVVKLEDLKDEGGVGGAGGPAANSLRLLGVCALCLNKQSFAEFSFGL